MREGWIGDMALIQTTLLNNTDDEQKRGSSFFEDHVIPDPLCLFIFKSTDWGLVYFLFVLHHQTLLDFGKREWDGK